MIRALTLAAVLAAGLAAPALATDTARKADGATAPATQSLLTAEEARKHLRLQGYTHVSGLTKDESGKWIGTAMKNGRTVAVAVDLRGEISTPAN